ncbi:hypothetical protein BRADI_5g08363v3 [Brachypodium distachyon]|uniref:Uncharacterized protein n=1 Tax=Brachypodium distachyon TaxID=15368 RepID=A0A0Q3E3C7_BRADI|nr:hypothetical protein BRADI_5g08363v3 [Brachypodium distachyon]
MCLFFSLLFLSFLATEDTTAGGPRAAGGLRPVGGRLDAGRTRVRLARDAAPASAPTAVVFMEAAASVPVPAAAAPLALASPAVAPPAPAPTDPTPPASPVYEPTMKWMMAGPAAPMIGEDDDFVLALAQPPLPLYCPIHGHGPCPTRDGMASPPPSPTPPATPPRPDLISSGGGTPEADHDGDEDAGLYSVHPEARRLLRRFTAAMAAHYAGPAGGGWNPATLSLSSTDEGGPSIN